MINNHQVIQSLYYNMFALAWCWGLWRIPYHYSSDQLLLLEFPVCNWNRATGLLSTEVQPHCWVTLLLSFHRTCFPIWCSYLFNLVHFPLELPTNTFY